jgi:sigma-B regulation protein RsbU (phosphoserine phosphatase)
MPILFHANEKPGHLILRGIALGVKENAQYEEEEIPVTVGDKILIYTDGVTEAMNASMQEYGEERLQELVAGSRTPTCVGLIEEILADVNAHVDDASRHDDMTVVLLKRLR